MTDRTTIVGMVATVALLLGVMVAGTGFSVQAFWQAPSLVLVLGGLVLTTMAAYPLARLRTVGPMLRKAFVADDRSADESIITLVAMAEIVRREGMLALEKPVEQLPDLFMVRGLRMVVDGFDAATIRSVMETEMAATERRHEEARQMITSVARSAPAFGMMGTLIGLVIMLGGMTDASGIGPGMAIALLTTLYGLVVANVLCWPLARKLAYRSRQEQLHKKVIVEGVLAVQAGDHPRIIVRKLQAFFPSGEWAGEEVISTASAAEGTDEAAASPRFEEAA